MKTTLRNVLPDAIWRHLAPVMRQLQNALSLARVYGQYRSMKSLQSVDGAGIPIPWYTYPATEYLGSLDLSDATVFEYGSGNSSLWWSRRVRSIIAIENDKEWFDLVSRSELASNFDYIFSPPDQFPKQI